MYKDELIQVHHLLLCLMKFLLDNGAPQSYFEDYLALSISPHHIHKTKAEHKYAILALSSGISQVLAENSDLVPQTLFQRLRQLSIRAKKELR
ncbi:MAG: hypothetical protein D6733_03355 [Methanobacteriota archaeon]|nr:MAG: hypothetical protein D6733_03355 [Euryarchaeota archaeon]